MHRRQALMGLGILGFTGWSRIAVAEEAMVVVVNRGNPLSELSPAALKAIFTARRLYWPEGTRIVPFNFTAKHPLRVAFDKAVLHMDPDEVARYWIDRRVRGGDRPPRQIPTASLLLRVVAKLTGGIGYLSESDVTDEVKVIAKVSA